MNLKNQIEALLFSSGKNMGVEQLAELTSRPKNEVIEALNQLKKEYNERDSALIILGEDNMWKIHVRGDYLPLVQRIVADTELPGPVLETLAVIAFKSPCLQSDVIKTRGSGAYEHITALLELEFVTREKKGRSFVIKPTTKFYDYFEVNKENLKNILADVKMPEPAEKEEPRPKEPRKMAEVNHEELDKLRKELEERTKVLEAKTGEVTSRVKKELKEFDDLKQQQMANAQAESSEEREEADQALEESEDEEKKESVTDSKQDEQEETDAESDDEYEGEDETEEQNEEPEKDDNEDENSESSDEDKE